MKTEFIRRDSSNRRLILIYAGWSTGPSLFSDVGISGWDVAVTYDYTDLSADTSFLEGYSTVLVFAWSLGVRMAAVSLPPEKITAAYAINGTLFPVNDTEGIPEAIYEATAANLDRRNLLKFRRRMAGDAQTFHKYFSGESNDAETECLRSQLYTVRDSILPEKKLPWRRAYISDNDLIFPPANMQRSWKHLGVETIRTETPHFVPMKDVISGIVPESSLISRRFESASDSYNNNAPAQKEIAAHLAGILAESGPAKGKRILEIGPGTGLFTSLYGSILAPRRAEFVDIATVGPFGIAETETYHKQDAETWITQYRNDFDYILSASTVQWFCDPEVFISNCRKALRPGGRLLISSFLPGNLGELDSLRPSPIFYHHADTYRKWMEKNFSDVSVESEEIRLSFSSPRDLMLHLKLTGVAGSAPSPGISPAALRNIRHITYRPVYMTGVLR